jgi:ribonucleoside-triphosphate reductase
MIRLTESQINAKIDWMEGYINAENAATGSTLDSNANVSSKNIATLDGELAKDFKIQINRKLISNRIETMFGKPLAESYIKDLESHLIYCHDETSLAPYCVSITMYPFLIDGMKGLGGDAEKPEHLSSFCGNFVNLAFAIASQFAGAVATVEFLMYFDYFAKLDYGDDYLNTNIKEIVQQLQGVVFALNQPAAARGFQSIFWNISTFDKYFFESMFGEFVFPDMSKPSWDSLDKLQRAFHTWFREERTKKLLTFPVVTQCFILDKETKEIKDEAYHEFISDEMAKGNEFFIYTSDTADSLASCCRLKNEIKDNTFSYSLGAGGVSTGSKNVITINMNRLVQEGHNLNEVINRVQQYQLAFNEHFKYFEKSGLLPVYTSGFISMDKQYLTLGVNGLVEAAEYLGFEISNNDEYIKWLGDTLSVFKVANKAAGLANNVMFNTECVPAENLGIKNAKWDRADGLVVNRDCYNSYFYKVEDELNVFDKMEMHGEKIVGNLDGGSAFHFNNTERLSYKQYYDLLNSLGKSGCNYFCENVKKTCCNECGTITANTLKACPKCNSENIDYATRVIGYLKRVKSFSKERINEESRRKY